MRISVKQDRIVNTLDAKIDALQTEKFLLVYVAIHRGAPNALERRSQTARWHIRLYVHDLSRNFRKITKMTKVLPDSPRSAAIGKKAKVTVRPYPIFMVTILDDSRKSRQMRSFSNNEISLKLVF